MKKATKQVFGLAGLGIGASIGAKVVSDIGAPGVPGAAGAMTSFGAMLPAAGTVIGGGLVLRQVGQLGKMVKRRK